MKKILTAIVIVPFLAFPSVSFASTLTAPQADAILAVLVAFGVDQDTIANIRMILAPSEPVQGTINTSPVSSPQQTASTTQSAPVAGSINNQSSAPMPEDKSAIIAKVVGQNKNDSSLPFGSYSIKVQVLDKDGKPTGGTFITNPRDENATKIPVTMTAPGNLFSGGSEAIIDSIETTGSKDYFHTFGYAPKTGGSKSLTFVSGKLSTTIKIDVQ